jgi:NTP pyrophosphatase (non-canonical NTP hydrolase)
MKNVQEEVEQWVQQYKIGYFKPLEILARLTEETGELARELNHRFGPKKKKDTEDTKDIEDEVGDIIFTLACLANSLGLDLDRGFAKVMDKLNGRDKDRWEKKEEAK